MEKTPGEKIADLMSMCVRCGRCDKVCPSHRHGGCSPFTQMGGGDGNPKVCIGCGKCTEVCPRTNPKLVMMISKALLLDLHPPERYRECGYITTECDPALREGIPESPDGDDVYIMTGCVAKRKVPFLVYSTRRALDILGIGNAELPGNACCTYPVVFRLEPSESNRAARQALGDSAGGRETVAMCGGCSNELLLNDIDFPHISVFLARNADRILKLPRLNMKVAVEPGCSMESHKADLVKVVEACGCEVVNKTTGCCGKGIPGVNAALMAEREAECEGAEAIVLGCPNCFTPYDSQPNGLPVLYVTELVCLAVGEDYTQRYHNIKLGGQRCPTRFLLSRE